MDEGGAQATSPSLLRHVEQTLAIASRSGLAVHEQFELAAIVDDYVFGYAMRVHHGAGLGAEGDTETRLDAMVAYLTAQLDMGELPHLEAIAGDDPAAAFARFGHTAGDEARFERGLQRVLDGIELWVQRARKDPV
jgi:hypothetical protein